MSGPLANSPGRCHHGFLAHGLRRIQPSCGCSSGADTVTWGAPELLRLGPMPSSPCVCRGFVRGACCSHISPAPLLPRPLAWGPSPPLPIRSPSYPLHPAFCVSGVGDLVLGADVLPGPDCGRVGGRGVGAGSCYPSSCLLRSGHRAQQVRIRVGYGFDSGYASGEAISTTMCNRSAFDCPHVSLLPTRCPGCLTVSGVRSPGTGGSCPLLTPGLCQTWPWGPLGRGRV